MTNEWVWTPTVHRRVCLGYYVQIDTPPEIMNVCIYIVILTARMTRGLSDKGSRVWVVFVVFGQSWEIHRSAFVRIWMPVSDATTDCRLTVLAVPALQFGMGFTGALVSWSDAVSGCDGTGSRREIRRPVGLCDAGMGRSWFRLDGWLSQPDGNFHN